MNNIMPVKELKNKLILIPIVVVAVITISMTAYNFSALNDNGGEEQHVEKVKPDVVNHSFIIDSFEVPIAIANGSINKITKDQKANSIVVEMSTHDEGYLEIQLPKNLFQALNDDYSKFFYFVISDGEETSYKQIDSNTIKIPFESNTTRIEIIGASELN